jgi:predicted type IV restriction endonuclease
MKTGRHVTISDGLNKWSAPLGAMSILIGGVVWLTELHSIAKDNHDQILSIQMDLDNSKDKIEVRLNDLEERLARIEGKIDMLVEHRKRRID